jgi:cellulose synthase/poly-beta-1,6-N-acetylglucosamine synthase-like glycosyltransferase
MTHPVVSVVIATRNRAALLGQTLDALAGQHRPGASFEIIVADNVSTDDTAAMVSAFAARADAPPTTYLHVETPGKSHAVNAAVERARGELLALTDDDVLPSPDWIDSLAEAFADPAIDFVAGRIKPRWEVEPPAWMSPELYGVLAIPDNGDRPRAIDASDPAVIPIGANMAVRRAVMARVGGLRADLGKLEGTLRTGEDHEFFLRMVRFGYHGRYVPSALVRHRVPRTRLDRGYFRKWLHQNGQDVARIEASYPPDVPRLLGVPRYLWRQAAADAARVLRAAVRRNQPQRFAATLRLIWFGGYLREAWRGRGVPSPAPLQVSR